MSKSASIEDRVHDAYSAALEGFSADNERLPDAPHPLVWATDDTPVITKFVPDDTVVTIGPHDIAGFVELHQTVKEGYTTNEVEGSALQRIIKCMHMQHLVEVSAMRVFNPENVGIGIGAAYILDEETDELVPSMYPVTGGDYIAPKLGYGSVLSARRPIPNVNRNDLAEVGYFDIDDLTQRILDHNSNGATPELYVPMIYRSDTPNQL